MVLIGRGLWPTLQVVRLGLGLCVSAQMVFPVVLDFVTPSPRQSSCYQRLVTCMHIYSHLSNELLSMPLIINQ